jgi:hypothetical protein
MSTAGPNSGSTFTTDGSGAVAWVNPGNAIASDNIYATATVAAHFDSPSDYLVVTGFGFSVPTGSTINGITVEIEQKRNNNNGTVMDASILSIKSGVAGGTDQNAGATWPISDTYKTYGGSSNLWGQTWTPSDINASNFGVECSAEVTGGSSTSTVASIDHVRITIDYTPAGSSTPQKITLGVGI